MADLKVTSYAVLQYPAKWFAKLQCFYIKLPADERSQYSWAGCNLQQVKTADAA